MIANTSSGKRFGPLAVYLVAGRSGTETERVAWTAGRNLGTDDPAIAAPLMQATARQSTLVRAPDYHLTISFDHQDQVTPRQMQAVADRVLRDLGLAEHQALMVAHRDREHAHVHIMVNRVHPDTGVAWERWQDRPKIERALREEERAVGLRQVAGRLHEIQSTDIPRRDVFADSRRQLERTCDPAFVQRVRSALPQLRAARSWEDLATRLAEHGLRVEGKGQGLVLTDGAQEVKASRVGRDLSLRRLEERFGTPYPAREQFTGAPVRAHAELTPAAAEVAASAREIERVRALHQARYRTEQDLCKLQGKRENLEHAVSGVTSAARAFDRLLSYVYREPESAREAIRDATSGLSANGLAELIRSEPERFGALRTLEQRRAFGLFNVDDDAKARASATIVAREWNTLATREKEAITLSTDYARAVEHRFAGSLAVVYRNPIAAREAFELARAHAGESEAIRTLAQSPDRLGALRAPGTAPEVARLDWATLAERARDALAKPPVTSAELSKEHVEERIHGLNQRRGELRDSLEQAPDRELLTRAPPRGRPTGTRRNDSAAPRFDVASGSDSLQGSADSARHRAWSRRSRAVAPTRDRHATHPRSAPRTVGVPPRRASSPARAGRWRNALRRASLRAGQPCSQCRERTALASSGFDGVRLLRRSSRPTCPRRQAPERRPPQRAAHLSRRSPHESTSLRCTERRAAL